MDEEKDHSKQGCINKYCPESLHQENSKKYCATCSERYDKQFFCIYCQQIYFETTDDGKNWILCETCNKWVHEDCANISLPKNTAREQNFTFNCIKCKKLSNNTTKEGGVGSRKVRQPVKNMKKTDSALYNLNFEWALSPEQIQADLKKMQEYLKSI